MGGGREMSVLPVSREETESVGWKTVKNIIRVIVACTLVAAFWYNATHAPEIKLRLGAFLYWIQGLGLWGMAILLLVQACSVVLLVPSTLLTIGAEYCFGIGYGFPTVLGGCALGACVSFWLGRTLAGDCVKGYFSNYSSYIRGIDKVLLNGR